MKTELCKKYENYTVGELFDAVNAGELCDVTLQAYDLDDFIKQAGPENIVAIVHDRNIQNHVTIYIVPEAPALDFDATGCIAYADFIRTTFLKEFYTIKNAGSVRKSVTGHIIEA